MSRNNDHYEKRITTSALRCTMLLALTAGATLALAGPPDGCTDVVRIPLDTVVRDVAAAAASRCYAVDVPAAGLLALEVSAPDRDGIEPRLVDFGLLCGHPAARHAAFHALERLATRQLLEIRSPGAYHFCIGAQEPEQALGSYKLSSLFTATFSTKGGDPREEEPDPDLRYEDPTTVTGAALRVGFDASCRALFEDDHGDTLLCATPVGFGGEVEGEIWNGWGDDEDLFVFLVDELATVRVEATTESVSFGGLYDGYGHRLHAETDSDGAGWHVFKTLAPGRYAVRVAGYDGLGGRYRLRVEVTDR